MFEVYNEIDLAEDFALESAFRFMVGQKWNMDDYMTLSCENYKFDRELVELATRVLFAPAVVYIASGKNV